MSQSIQRRLEEIEVTFKDLEEKGVVLERTLREETGKNSELVQVSGLASLTVDCQVTSAQRKEFNFRLGDDVLIWLLH